MAAARARPIPSIPSRTGILARVTVLNYQRYGAGGPSVVLLHGLGSCGADWLLQVEALQPHYQVLTPDLRGHGDSPMPPGWPGVQELAGDVAELLDRLGLGVAHLVGLSLGGGVALDLAVRRPELVRSLTIVNASASLGGGLRRVPVSMVRLALLLAGPMPWLGAWVAQGLFPAADQQELRKLAQQRIARNSRMNYLKAVLAVLRFDLRKRIGQIRAPTLVVAGDRDRTIPLGAKRALAAAIPGARLELIQGSGHATPLDAPERFNRVLLAFLQDVG